MFRRAMVVDRGRGDFTLLDAPGRAWKQGPGPFGHVNVIGSVGSVGPPTKFSQR